MDMLSLLHHHRRRLAIVMASFLILSSQPLIVQAAIDSSESNGSSSSGVFEWEILTKRNFSSQIRLHPHLLLMVTVPWSGESRSLMKELTQLVANKQEKFGTLKLVLLYRNRERMLADVIGATEGITILCYHHSLPYKYQGRLRAQNILSSAHFLMTHPPEQLPLESLKTPEDLKTFLQSTDKALLLMEFCGWTHALLAKGKNNGTENGFDGQFGVSFIGETNRSLAAKGKKNQKGMENEKMTCGVQSGASGLSWLGEFSSVTEIDFLVAKNMSPTVGISCSFEQFQRFESFFSKFMTVAREFFLPPERLRFGLVPERLLLSSLGVGDSGSWFSSLDVGISGSWSTILYFAGCPSCSKVLGEGDDLKIALQMQSSLLVELGSGGNDPEPALPANKPSILLFIDRSSDSLETRRKSKEAIDAFRNLALHYQTSCGIGEQNNIKTDKSVFDTNQASKSITGHQRFKLSPTSRNVELKDKMSIMIVNEEKHVTLDKIPSDLQGKSLHEILEYVLQHKDKVKLSSLAKEAGFQLLSEDFEIKIQEALPAQTKVLQSDQVFSNPTEGLPEASFDLHKDQIPYMDGTSVAHEEQYKPANTDKSSQYTEEKTTSDTNKQSYGAHDHFHGNQVLGSAEDVKMEQKTFSERANLSEEIHFKGSFFFSDGGYQLLKALSAGSKIPSVVIVDPILQKHYVLPEETVFSYSSLSDFLDGFLNGSLLPYQRSESVVPSPRKAPSPPFVNLDFHEVDSIPRVTTRTFSELVIGFNQSDISSAVHAWKKDVLVLFSNSWCGFCQRTELVVREVYRAFKHYATMLQNAPRNEKSVLTDDMKDIALKLPQIYFMDCTLNECSLILKSVAQRELYPSLLLFPAEGKNAVSYEGNVAVREIIKFIVDHGNNGRNLVKEEGILWAGVERECRENLYEDASQIAVHKEAPLSKDKYHEVQLKYRIPARVVGHKPISTRKSNGLRRAEAPQVVVGSLLIATEKLLNVHPFDNSTILIVKADESTGFQGLIINKHISWDSLEELKEGLEILRAARLSFGGPLLKRGMLLVSLTQKTIEDRYPEVLPNVYFVDQRSTIHEIEGLKSRNHSVTDFWFFLGYSSWGWDQLFDEIAQGAWNISSDNVEELDWPWR
ncbi:uncharacterized protein LOC114317458 [Camellia sinensis]|uniref:uncharacterized protein LOC114317458 n=1 Tax=Camellia sinensis TaxID=4442 RepID=UPI0010365EF8|nr:uncharacterized protein LOC114317458 [Camellia sinensis]